MITRRNFLKMSLAAGAAVAMSARMREALNAAAAAPATAAPGSALRSRGLTIRAAAHPDWPYQTPLPASAIPQFVDPLPDLKVIVDNGSQIDLEMKEFKHNVLPSGFVLPNGQTYDGTWVWGYRTAGQPDVANSYIGPVVVAFRNQPTEMKFVNNLGDAASTNVLAYKYSVDQTLHWANPDENMCMMGEGLPSGTCAENYTGSIPAVPHLHGGEVPAFLDGGPDAWFTSDGSKHGKTFYSKDMVQNGKHNYCIYRYPNTQEAGLIWFHDHTLGATRLNVYCGLAGGYLLYDPDLGIPDSLKATTILDPNNPAYMPTVPLVIQDRMFDQNGQWYFPAAWPDSPNPEHPYWVPEFVGDAVVVNGKAWPYLDVQPRRYRFLIINGSNARTYELFFTNIPKKMDGPVMWQVGSDGAYLDQAVKIDPSPSTPKGQLRHLVMMPGERADIVVDFSTVAGQTLTLKNVAKTPYPAGETPQGSTLGKILQVRVAYGKVSDGSWNPAVAPAVRPAGQKLVRLSGPTVFRELTLNEIMGMPVTAEDPVSGDTVDFEGGPMEILVNNTKWSGRMHDGMATRPGFVNDKVADVSELPVEGVTEFWEIVNLTADAHPIHTHLVQFQAVSRQYFDVAKYKAAYAAKFPGSDMIDPMTGQPYAPGVFVPGFGPPLDPSVANGAGKLGGNPDVKPFLQSVPLPPAPNESGWKDTIQCPPGMVTRFMIRFAPTSAPAGSAAAFPFDPGNQNGTGSDYVWHCHIVDHEDNEMMRPYTVIPSGAARTYNQGTDY